MKRLCESVRKLCPLPAWRSTVYSSSTSLESGSTNLTHLLSLVPSPITPFCALMEVRRCCWTQKSNFQLCLLVCWCFNKHRKKSSSCSPVTAHAVVESASLAKASAHSRRNETVAPLSWSEAQRNAWCWETTVCNSLLVFKNQSVESRWSNIYLCYPISKVVLQCLENGAHAPEETWYHVFSALFHLSCLGAFVCVCIHN